MSQTSKRRLIDELCPAELTARERQKLLRSDRRQLALDVLSERTPPVELREVATEVAAREEGNPDEDTIERVAVTLRYDHLPSMADLDILEFEPEANLIYTSGG